LNTQSLSALVAAIVGLAIGGSVVLREPRRSAHVLFATLALNIALYSLFSAMATSAMAVGFGADTFEWLKLAASVSLPATAQRFFRAFLGEEAGPPPLSRSTVVLAGMFYLALAFSLLVGRHIHTHQWFGLALALYVFAGLYLSVFYLYRRYLSTPSRVEKIRLLYLVVGGVVTVSAAILDLVPESPSLGNILITIYLYFLSQTLVRYRLLDLNELLGRMVVLAAMVLIVTIIYSLLVQWVDPNDLGRFFFNSLLASTAIIILYEPLRSRVDRLVNRWMFQEKFELFRRIENLRNDLMNVIDVRDLVPRVLAALEDSRRVTHAALYVVDPDGSGYELKGHFGPRPEARLDAIANRAFLERLRRGGVVSIEGLERELAALKNKQGEERESLLLMTRALESLNGSVVLAVVGEEQLLGMLALRDERLREAYSSDEIELFRGVATSIGITLQNSQVYERMKERDRLAALGQMAAGLAHEIRNPLGSIKGAAQYLQPGQTAATSREGTREFLDIIIEEVNRLNKIVSQFLDYARPYRGEQRQLEVAEVLRKTLALFAKEAEEHGKVEIVTDLADKMPPVRADAEQLLQVFLNLSLNALQAMPNGGKLWISTALRRSTRRGAAAAFLEVRFRDAGVGIPAGDLKNLFIPFFTTKEKGTGLGLPISQRIIENHGGTIEVRSQPGEGATFTVLLPIEADVYAAYSEALRAAETARAAEAARRAPPAPTLPPPPPGRLPPPAPAGPARRPTPPTMDRGKLPIP
jgi:two-component system, NtrC family, sensor histidine kinase HydH